MNLSESDWLLIQKGMWQSSKKSQDFWLPVMDYPRALEQLGNLSEHARVESAWGA